MASQSASYARLLVQKLFVKTSNNQNISTNHILIANGNGGTYWNSVSSIFPVSSFKTVVGGNNLTSTFSADVKYNTLLVSTTAIPDTFVAFVDPTTSSLMLSLQNPPIVINGGSVDTVATVYTDNTSIPNSNAVNAVSLYSSIKFFGVQDIKLSTINTKQSVFVGISSFTAAGYSTLKGSLSTAMLSPQSVSFVSSIPYDITTGSGMSTNDTGQYVSSLFTSSIRFDTKHLQQYINMANFSTSITFDYKPNYLFRHLCSSNEPLDDNTGILPSTIKPIVSYIQGTGAIFSETSTIRYITSQNISTSASYSRSLSNYYTESVRMKISPIDLSTQIGINTSYPVAIYHRIDNCLGDYTRDVLFANSSIKNLTEPVGALYVTVNNTPIFPSNGGNYGNPSF
jgi:hypothetical protein